MDPPTPPRKLLKRRQVTDGIRFLTFSTYKRLPLLNNPHIRTRFAEILEQSHQKFRFILIAWVAMPEHAHLLLRPAQGDNDITQPLTWFKRELAKEVIARWRQLRAPILTQLKTNSGKTRFWQPGGGYDRNIWSNDELFEKVTYIHHNPVKRKLVNRPADWEWSSARWYTGDRSGPVTIDQTAWHVQP